MLDGTTSINAFLDAAAARKPTPGGGAVAALTGAMAASMGEMVVNYSIGKKGLESHQERLGAVVKVFQRARSLQLQLMAEDQDAFEMLSAARKLPEGSEERREMEPAALLVCVRIPQAIAGTSAAVLETCESLVAIVNYHLLSDLAVCADLAMASVRCALYNVRTNLRDNSDPRDAARLEVKMNKVLSHAVSLIQRVGPRIWERHNAGA